MTFFKPRFLTEWNAIRKEGGYKLLFQKKGWVILAAFVSFYLVRDTVLYILIPYLTIKGIMNCN